MINGILSAYGALIFTFILRIGNPEFPDLYSTILFWALWIGMSIVLELRDISKKLGNR